MTNVHVLSVPNCFFIQSKFNKRCNKNKSLNSKWKCKTKVGKYVLSDSWSIFLWPEKNVVKKNQTELCKMCNDNLLLESVTRHKFKNEVDKQNVGLGCGVLAQ